MALLRDSWRRAAPKVLQSEMGGSLASIMRTHSGKYIDNDSALNISAVYRAVSIIANTIATLPVQVHRLGPNQERVPVTDDSTRFLWARPNPEVSRATFWSTVIGHEVLTGNAYIYVVGRGKTPMELWPIEPKRVKPGRDKQGNKVYEIDGQIPARDWTAGGEIVHVAGFSSDGLVGISPIQKGAQSLGISMAAEEWAGRYFSQASPPGGYLTTDQPLTPLQAQAYSEMWEEAHQGSANAHRLAVLGSGTKWNSTSINPEDSQLLETRKFQVTDIERWFGVPPHLMFDVEKTTSWGSGIAEQGLAFVTYTLNQHCVVFEQTVGDELLPDGIEFAFDTSGLMRGKLTDQIEAVGGLIRAGFNPAASLRAVGMEPIDHTGFPPVTVKSSTTEGEEILA